MKEEDYPLSNYYKFVYTCDCGKKYGSDKVEKKEHICPICLDKKEQIDQKSFINMQHRSLLLLHSGGKSL